MPSPTIRLGGPLDADFLEITLLEVGNMGGRAEGGFGLRVSVACDRFAGSYDGVWVEKQDWLNFLSQLRLLEERRAGDAALASLSPEAFELHLQIVDRAGHLVAYGCLSRYHFGHPSGSAARSRIEYHLEIDPGRLREIVTASEDLVPSDPNARKV